MENGSIQLTPPTCEQQPPAGEPARFSWRALTSVLLAAAFLIVALSGVVLFVMPPGRVANWGGWTGLGLSKRDWMELHLCFGAVFLVAAIIHGLFNLRCLVGYFRRVATRRIGLRPEWVLALILATAVFVGTRAGLWPFSAFLSWRETLRRSAVTAPARPGASDTERPGTPQPSARGPGAPLRSEDAGGGGGFGGRGRGGQGPGWGQMTLQQYCEAQKLDLKQVQPRLAAKGIRAAPGRTLRQIAADNGYESPRQILALLEAGGD